MHFFGATWGLFIETASVREEGVGGWGVDICSVLKLMSFIRWGYRKWEEWSLNLHGIDFEETEVDQLTIYFEVN